MLPFADGLGCTKSSIKLFPVSRKDDDGKSSFLLSDGTEDLLRLLNRRLTICNEPSKNDNINQHTGRQITQIFSPYRYFIDIFSVFIDISPYL